MPFMSTRQRLFLQAFLVSLVAPRCLAKLVNATIDDTFGDTRSGSKFQYTPPVAWRDGQVPCPVCNARPNSAQLYNRTWHDSTRSDPNEALNNIPTVATAQFSGTGIYVYCALGRPDDEPNFATRSDMTFYIDGKEVGTFQQEPPGGDGFDYDALVYQNTALAPGDHEFVLQNGRADAQDSLVLLDRIVYTYDDGDDDGSNEDGSNEGGSSKSNPNLAAIIGGALGGVAALCLIGAGTAIWFLKRRRRKLSEENSSKVEGNLAPTPYYPIAQAQRHVPLHTHAPLQNVAPHGNEGLPQYEELPHETTVATIRQEKRR
ncbi:hypothetical protein BKA70DRAFT_1184023 [Coprinopsis sp. MPI-PUGE-AT-0042]|nr:hypothetical protein BKA70DRAFT_1184023 [Coprinopsis sp. MPI-PUGE-AT-0042]